MARITALRISPGRRKRVKISLDDRPGFSLEAEVVVQEGLRTGQELSQGQIEALKRQGQFQRCLNAAGHYLSYRPRSESELRQRLIRRGFDADDVATVLAKLKGQGLVDDTAFAQFWKDNRQQFSPRSQWLTRRELRQKGVSDDIIDQVLSTLDDGDSAYQAARARAGRLSLSDKQEFGRRLGGYLKRRGFGYGVIRQVVDRIWQEMGRDKNSDLP